MELTNTFKVNLPVEATWDTFLDVERLAPHLPGAQLQEIEGEEYRGIVAVKVGPVNAKYKGSATIASTDVESRRIVIEASGKETKGQGYAQATITVDLLGDGSATEVTVNTDLRLAGRVAQFGRGVLADVSSRLVGQFVDALEADLEAQGASVQEEASAGGHVEEAVEQEPAEAAEETGEAASPGVRRVEMPEPEPIDLLEAAGAPLAKRVVPAVVVAVVVAVVFWLLGRRRG